MSPTDVEVISFGGSDGPPRRRPVPPIAVIVLALAVGGVAGYLIGARPTVPVSTPSPTPTLATGPANGDVVVATGARCSQQIGNRLQLGLEVTNASPELVVLASVEPMLPLGGLRSRARSWGPCGQLSPPATGSRELAPAATIWFTETFQVDLKCPAPLPVQFVIDYTRHARAARAYLTGFVDLGEVPYSGCDA
jgi:hypothetical protein